MTCGSAQRLLAGYLDGAISSRDHAHVRAHLDGCPACRRRLESYRRLAMCLANITPAVPPHDLALRIRVEASREPSLANSARRVWSRAVLVFRNILEPLALPATGGVLAALIAFVLLVQNILVGVPLGGVVANDQPLNLVQPARLESLAPFPLPGVSNSEANSEALLLEATLNAQGQVVSYKILAGPHDLAAQHQLDQVLLFSRFRPLVNFGRPTDGGRVVLSFSEVRVRG
jgi:hypothetical protein